MTFQEAFQDQSWTSFILTKYENSAKPEHMMFVKYVELRMKELDLPKETPKKKDPPKATRPRSSTFEKTSPSVDEWEQISAVEMGEENLSLMQDEMNDLRLSNQHIHQRMARVETCVEEIMNHLRAMSIKTENQ